MDAAEEQRVKTKKAIKKEAAEKTAEAAEAINEKAEDLVEKAEEITKETAEKLSE